MPSNATSKKSLEAVHAFIDNYVEENTIVLPGRFPGFKNEEIRLLIVFIGNKDECLEGVQENLWCFKQESHKLQEILTTVGRILS